MLFRKRGNIMHPLFQNDCHISNIFACVYVPSGSGQMIHRNRTAHGLVFQLSGKKIYHFLSGQDLPIEAGQAFYLPYGSDYDVEDVEAGDCIAVNFSLSEARLHLPPFALCRALSAKYVTEFRTLYQAWEQQRPGDRNLCFACLYRILSRMEQDTVAPYASTHHRRLMEQAMTTIRTAYSDPQLTVARLAAQAGISPEYFRKLFWEVYGVSPKKFLSDLRMEKAKELLLSGEFRIGQIASLCGYDSVSYFSREFKRHTGKSPSAFLQP